MSSEWTTVTAGKKAAGRNGKKSGSKSAKKVHAAKPSSKAMSNEGLQMKSGDFSVHTLMKTVNSLRSTAFYSDLLSALSRHEVQFRFLVGLGIGNFSESQSSLLQLALLICLGDDLVQRSCTAPAANSRVCIFDPVMPSEDIATCSSLGIRVLTDNSKGKHANPNEDTLYFMPHCPYRLYCNLLWSNWTNLPHTYILGNSFVSYSLRRMSSEASESDLTDSVVRLLPFLEETAISESLGKTKGVPHLAHLENALCDTSFIRLSRLLTADQREQFDTVLSNRASEEAIDISSQLDEELF